MGKKFYAVRKGMVTGILDTWDECRDSVHGYPGAEYKSFGTRSEAETYLNLGRSCAGKQVEAGSVLPSGRAEKVRSGGAEKVRCGGRRRIKADGETAARRKASAGSEEVKRSSEGELVAYVDGSYHAGTKEFSYGVVLLMEEEELCFSEKMADAELAAMHNVAGEIKGAEAAMRYALENGYRKIVIYHDYEGISKWCLGLWKTNKEGTKAYKAFYDSIKGRLDVKFVKVTGHSNDKYNDMADELAKGALGIGTNSVL